MGCHKKSKKNCPSPCEPKKSCYRDCEKIALSYPQDLSNTITPILMVNAGDGFSGERILFIEAEVSPSFTGVGPVTATFQLQLDGVALDPQVSIQLSDSADDIPIGDKRSQLLRAEVRVTAGVHAVTLLGSGDVSIELNPSSGGASLLVCEKVG